MNINTVRAEIEKLRVEARGLVEPAGAGEAAAVARFDAISARVAELQATLARLALVDDLDRRAAGETVAGTGDSSLDRLAADVGLLDVIRAQMGGTDAAAGRAREVSQELERRSGRKAEGVLWNMSLECRTLTTVAPVAGPGSNLIPTVQRADLFIDRLRNATKVRALGATVLSGLRANISIPKRTASVAIGWVAEDSPVPVSDPAFASVGLTPKHAGAISEWSRNMIMQSSPDVEQLARTDMALQLAEVLDSAAIAGTGTNSQPTGIMNTPGVGKVTYGPASGFAPDYDQILDLMGLVQDTNAGGDTTGFLMSNGARRALAKIRTTTGEPLGLATVLQGERFEVSNLMPTAARPGPLSQNGSLINGYSIIYGNWSDLLIGLWSELDILVNPYASPAYSKGNVQIRAMMTCDIAVRHAQAFAYIDNLIGDKRPVSQAARFPDGTERRAAPLELRAGAGRVLEGYAAVFDSPTRIADLFTETVKRGAFSASLAGRKPVFLLAQHDFAQPLAKSGTGGTLILEENAKGLRFSATLPETRAGDDVLAQARAGIVTGASFGFRVPAGGEVWPSRDKRELIRVDLLEISAVTLPAYADATVSARALAHARGSNAFAYRLRLLEL